MPTTICVKAWKHAMRIVTMSAYTAIHRIVGPQGRNESDTAALQVSMRDERKLALRAARGCPVRRGTPGWVGLVGEPMRLLRCGRGFVAGGGGEGGELPVAFDPSKLLLGGE